MGKTPSVAILIPHFKNKLSPMEKFSLSMWQAHLSHYKTFAVSPENIKSPDPKIDTKVFPSHYFRSVHDYSKLLLSKSFYEEFVNYDYILIYQLDAFVFSDQLKFWCDQNLSYIGAPWFSSLIGKFTAPHGTLRGGNGGLSLRRTKDCLQVLNNIENQQKPRIIIPNRGRWLGSAKDYPFNEDGFWSFEAIKYDANFKLASLEQSLSFAFETEPKKCFAMNNNKLPFGAHAWEKYDKKFWNQFK